MPKYKFAMSREGKLVGIDQITHERDRSEDGFTCVSCGQSIIAKTKGEMKEVHFAHKANPEIPCNKETYLHILGKRCFYNKYLESLESEIPFNISLHYTEKCNAYEHITGKSCIIGSKERRHNLIEYYDGIEMEKKTEKFIPDLKIFRKSKPEECIFIEIAVTHFLSEEKEKSDNKIIEITLESEDDISGINGRELNYGNSKFVGFKTDTRSASSMACKCRNIYDSYFIVYNSGKTYMLEGPLCEIDSHFIKTKGNIVYSRRYEPEEGKSNKHDQYMELAREAAGKCEEIKTCFACKYHGEKVRMIDPIGGVYCRTFKKFCHSNQASECDRYNKFEHFRNKPEV